MKKADLALFCATCSMSTIGSIHLTFKLGHAWPDIALSEKKQMQSNTEPTETRLQDFQTPLRHVILAEMPIGCCLSALLFGKALLCLT